MNLAGFPPQVTRGLGIAGLIPFVAPAALLWLDLGPSALMAHGVEAYAFGIICFLCGSWWGLALARGLNAPLIASNAIFLIAFFIYLLLPQWWPLGAALLLVTLFVVENATPLLNPFPSHYRKLRALLTSVAAASMLVVQAAG